MKQWVGFAVCVTTSLWAIPTLAHEAVGKVVCGGGRGTPGRQAELLFATVTPTAAGYDVLLLEARSTHVLSLNRDRIVEAASTLQSQTLLPWNLVAYDRTPMQLAPNGAFDITMMVSTRSSCRFQGKALWLKPTQP